MELGSFWAYYSLWFLEAVPEARAFLIEPDEFRMTAGRRNFELNQREGTFLEAAITDEVSAGDRPAEIPAAVSSTTVDVLMRENRLDQVDVLHADIQGFEVRMFEGASHALHTKSVRWIFISTHGENIHQRCLGLLRRHRYSIVEEHTPGESYSVDGLIVASSLPAVLPTPVSKLRTVASVRAKLRAIARVRILEPLGLRPVTQ